MARGGATCCVLIALVACRGREESRPAPAPPPRAIDPLDAVVLDDKPLDWTRPIAKRERDTSGYAGNQSCKRCHEQIYASYQRHSMARTGMRRIASVDQAWIGKLFDAGTIVKHERSGFAYRPVRRGRQFFVEEIMLDAGGGVIAKWEEPVTHVYSAGSYGLALFSRRGEQLIQMPIDYYAKAGRWDLDPGAFGGNPRLTMTLGPFCASCHIDEPARRFADPLPHGIGCERCHGPSERHVETLAVTDTINSAKLPARRQLDLCTQCHQSSFAILRDGSDHFGFHPGAALDKLRINFIGEPPERDRMKLLAHPERLVRSACWQKSKDKLTCTTCHDPHVSSLDKTDAWWDAKCLGCHTKESCTDTKQHRDAAGDHCWTCHMRAGTTGDVPLVTITDHWIQTRPPPIRTGSNEAPRSLAPWSTHSDDAVRDDEIGALTALGHAEAGLDDAALKLTLAAVQKRPTSRLYSLIAKVFIARRNMQNAGRAYRAALRLDLDDPNALLGYAKAMLDTRVHDEALHALDRLIAIEPGNVAALETKAIYLHRSGRPAVATELFRRAAETGVATATSFVGLALDARGNSTKQLGWLELAWRAEPRDRWILDELDLAARASGDEKRIAELKRRRAAIEASPPAPTITRASAWVP